ncbi:hypothetical protein BGX24_005648 [Mortierella sp. AD032]|nr:hypothetical protein BGX24_005648 [Mortierella sp. AD032]
MSDGYFDNDYGAQEDFDECYDEQLYGEEVENAYDQSQDDNEGEMDNYLAVQGGEQAESNIFSHGGKRSHLQIEHSNPATAVALLVIAH